MNAPKLLKEPFAHFLVAGTVLFAAYRWANRGSADHVQNGPRVVPITASDVTWLKETSVRQWRRPPSDEEVSGLVADYLREELLAREARVLRLDENDMIVRRRLAQKMTFLLEDTTHAAEPTDEEARRIYEASRERYLTPARISFTQIYFSPDRRGAGAAGDAESGGPPIRPQCLNPRPIRTGVGFRRRIRTAGKDQTYRLSGHISTVPVEERIGSPSSLREHLPAACQKSRMGAAGNAATLVRCGELWAAVSGQEPNGIQQVGNTRAYGHAHVTESLRASEHGHTMGRYLRIET